MRGKTWTSQETDYLLENWGTYSVGAISEKLGRSVNAVLIKKQKLGLGGYFDHSDYITFYDFVKAIGISGSYTYTKMLFVNAGFPFVRKKRLNTSYEMIDIDKFWIWAETHQHMIDFSQFKENVLGVEPDWAKRKRTHDVRRTWLVKTNNTPWTAAEDKRLISLLQEYKYTYRELSHKLNRTSGAIQRRCIDLGIKYRPVKAYNHIKWTDAELDRLTELIKDGANYEVMAVEINRSSKAIRSKVYVMYGSECLDNAMRILSGEETL